MITVFVFGGKKSFSVAPKVAVKLKRAKAKKQHPVEKNPLVMFRYPSSKEPWVQTLRQVRMIGANDTYIIGVQVNGPKAHFKKFRRDRMSALQLLEFNPSAIS